MFESMRMNDIFFHSSSVSPEAAPEERLHVAGVDHAHIVLVFVSGGTGHDEGHVDIVSRQPCASMP